MFLGAFSLHANVAPDEVGGGQLAWLFDSIIQELKDNGVTFEHYDDLPETTREDDVHVIGDFKSVWFKDPDGNILNLVNGSM